MDELTTDLRRAANTWLAEEYKACAEAVRYLLKEAADAIEELSRENESLAKSVNEASEILRRRWIPVEEKLPQENGFYLCLYKHKHPGGVAMDEGLSIQQWYNGRWNLNEIYAVTHWMPLPPAPKEESYGV